MKNSNFKHLLSNDIDGMIPKYISQMNREEVRTISDSRKCRTADFSQLLAD
jgi:hypothetical protein